MRSRTRPVARDALLTVIGIAVAAPAFYAVVRYLLTARSRAFVEPLGTDTGLILFVALPCLAALAVMVAAMVRMTAHEAWPHGLHLFHRRVHH